MKNLIKAHYTVGEFYVSTSLSQSCGCWDWSRNQYDRGLWRLWEGWRCPKCFDVHFFRFNTHIRFTGYFYNKLIAEGIFPAVMKQAEMKAFRFAPKLSLTGAI